MTWQVRLMLSLVSLAGAVAAGFVLYEFGRNIGGPGRQDLVQQVAQLQKELQQASTDRDRYLSQATSLESELKVQKVAQDQLVQQVSSLEADQNKLKEDLSFFESLLPAGKGDKGIAIRSVRVQPDPATGQLRFRLLVQQNGKPDHDFGGSVQLRVYFVQNGRPFTLDIPDPAQGATGAKDLSLSFRYYQRLEGPVSLPAGAVAKSVQVKVFAGKEMKLQQSFTL
jgi:hypothetical protein